MLPSSFTFASTTQDHEKMAKSKENQRTTYIIVAVVIAGLVFVIVVIVIIFLIRLVNLFSLNAFKCLYESIRTFSCFISYVLLLSTVIYVFTYKTLCL